MHYALTQQAEQEFSVAYPAALTAIVETLRAGQDPKALEGILTAAGVRLAGSVNARNAKGVLGALGAKVRSVATTGGGETVQGASCPLATTVSREPVTCELVRSLLATTLGRAVQMHCQHGDRPRCCFKIAPVRNQALRA